MNDSIEQSGPKRFDPARLRVATEDRDHSWALADRILMQVCRDHPTHSDRAAVNAKLLIIGRSYATGIERKVPTDGSQGSALSKVAALLFSRAGEVDNLISALPSNADHLSFEMLETILVSHGRLVELLKDVTRNRESARSFASKYLHFHRPVVPVYDSVTAYVIPKLIRWRVDHAIIPWRIPMEETYHTFVMRFWQLCLLARGTGENPTVKELDYYLMSE